MFILRLLINAVALLLIASYVPGIEVTNFYIALIAALILGILNATLRPLLTLLTLPITILTLGLFTLFINAFIFWFVSTFVKGFQVEDFSAALAGSILLWLVGWATNVLLNRGD